MKTTHLIILVIYFLSGFSVCVGQSNKTATVNLSKELLASAESGDPKSQFKVAQCYFSGKGIDKNTQEAVRWLKKSADQDDLNALTILFAILMKGEFGVAQDQKEAMKYLLKIANLKASNPETQQGINSSQALLAQLYFEGAGVEKNYKEALKWAEASASNGNPMGLAILGNLYLNGNDVEKNPNKAYEFYKQSATKNEKLGMMGEAFCLFKGLGVQQDYPLAFKKFKSISDTYKGQASVEATLGLCYLKGLGTEVDLQKAERHLSLAADEGSEEAKAYLVDVRQRIEAKLKATVIGKYRVEGLNEDLTTYLGEIDLSPYENRIKAVWKIEREDSKYDTFQGEGFISGKYLCIYFTGPSSGAALYEIQSESKNLDGTWIGEDPKVAKRYVGKEKLVKK